MALKLDFNICSKNNCRKFGFTETTGAYDATTNPTGWGAPNPTIASVTAATLTIYILNSTTPTLTINLLTSSPTFPSTDINDELEILNSSLGYSGRIPDGLHKFVYTVVANGSTYTQTKTIITSCNSKCCVDGLFGNITDFECDCQKAAIDKALSAQAIYKSMVSSAACGNIETFNKLKSMLDRMCNNINCCS